MDKIIQPARKLFGDRIKSELNARGWTQQILATKIGTARATVNWAANGKQVSNETIEKIVDTLEIDMPPGLRANVNIRLEAYGDYDQKSTIALCGRYEVFRPSSRAGKEINRTEMVLYWSDHVDCLVFYERTFTGYHWGRVFHNSAYFGWDFLSNAFGIPRLCRLTLTNSVKHTARLEGFSILYEDPDTSGTSPTIAIQIEVGEFFRREHAEAPSEISPSHTRYRGVRFDLNDLAEQHILREVP